MVAGNWPLLTKGPVAMFFLTMDATNSLDDRKPGDKYMLLLFVFSLVELLLFSTKKIVKKRLRGVEYSLIQTINDNFLNIYSFTFKILTLVLGAIPFVYWYFNTFGDDRGKFISPLQKLVFFQIFVETVIQWIPFHRNQPLR